jgi:tetratricopeptide (TPR) repeat protein
VDLREASLVNAANYYRRQGQLDNAVKFYEKAVSIRKQAEPRGTDLGMDLVHLGDALRQMGRSAEAQHEYEQAVAMLAPGTCGICLAQAKDGLGMVLVEQGSTEEGLEKLEEARHLLSPAAGSGSKLFSGFVERYAALLESIGRPAEAEQLRLESQGVHR